MLVPYGWNESRIPIKLVVHIISAHILFKDDKSLFSNFKSNILNSLNFFGKRDNEVQPDETSIQLENHVNLNPFVKVTFEGVTVTKF